MKLRIAQAEDLPRLREMYAGIVEQMNRQGLRVWDAVYPCAALPGDVEGRRLCLLEEDGEVVAAFALCESNAGADSVQWRSPRARALYLDRLGVRADCQRRGIGASALRCARELARRRGAQSLRLFVADVNRPAIALYERQGFMRAGGAYEERIDEDFRLRMYGYELTPGEPQGAPGDA